MDTIVDYLENSGYQLKRIGNNSWALDTCPFCGHKDCFRTKEDFFNCFSCNAAGDQYKFESLKNHVSYSEAKSKLTGSTIVRLPHPMSDLIKQNHDYIFAHPEHLKWLTDERKISLEVLKQFRIGCFAANDGRIHYTFPYYQDYQVQNVKYRTANKNLIYFKKGASLFLYNVNALQNTDSVMVVEGELDCLAAYTYELDIPCVSVGLGAGSYKLSWKDDFAHIKTIYLSFDSDHAGQSGVRKLAEVLGAEKCRIVKLPKKDMNDCLKDEVAKEVVEEAIKKSLTLSQLDILQAIEAIPQDTTVLGSDLDNVLNLIAARPDVEAEDYLRAIKERFQNVSYRQGLDFRNRIKTIQLKNKKEQTPVLDKNVVPEISEELKREAMIFLKSPNLLSILQSWLTDIGIIGEDFNKVCLWLFFLSRKMEKPIHSVCFGQSSSGKTSLVQSVLTTLPENVVMEFTSLSAHALDYRDEDIIGKVIFIAEYDGAQEVEYIVRVAQSEGKITRGYTIKDENTGDLKNVEKTIKIQSAFVITTTKSTIYQENYTRVFSLYADESMKQTQRVIEYIKGSQTREYKRKEPQRKHIVEVLQAAQYLLEGIEVDVPYAGLLEFPENTTRNRRDMNRFLSFIKVIALLRQHQKEIKEDELGKYIEADVQDYRLAHQFLLPIIRNTLDEITPRAMAVLEVCCLIQAEKNMSNALDEDRSFTTKEIQDRASLRGIDCKNVANLRQELQSLCEGEYLELVSGVWGQRGGRHTFKVSCEFEIEHDGSIQNIKNPKTQILSPDELSTLVLNK